MNIPVIVAKTSKEATHLPKFGKGPTHWEYGDVETRITLTFKQVLDSVNFSLENAFFMLGDKIIQQQKCEASLLISTHHCEPGW